MDGTEVQREHFQNKAAQNTKERIREDQREVVQAKVTSQKQLYSHYSVQPYAEASEPQMARERSPASSPGITKKKRPEVQIYVPRAKRIQQKQEHAADFSIQSVADAVPTPAAGAKCRQEQKIYVPRVKRILEEEKRQSEKCKDSQQHAKESCAKNAGKCKPSQTLYSCPHLTTSKQPQSLPLQGDFTTAPKEKWLRRKKRGCNVRSGNDSMDKDGFSSDSEGVPDAESRELCSLQQGNRPQAEMEKDVLHEVCRTISPESFCQATDNGVFSTAIHASADSDCPTIASDTTESTNASTCLMHEGNIVAVPMSAQSVRNIDCEEKARRVEVEKIIKKIIEMACMQLVEGKESGSLNMREETTRTQTSENVNSGTTPLSAMPEEGELTEEECAEEKGKNVEQTQSLSPPRRKSDSDWDNMFTDDGECLNPDLMEELTMAVGDVQVQSPQFDYRKYQLKDPKLDYDEFGHIIEIYDFPAEFKTQDLIAIFSEFPWHKDFDLKWVDDTRALGVFSNSRTAASAVKFAHPLLKVRPLSAASRESKLKAKRVAEFIQPYRPRPQTSAVAARRMLSGALGFQVRIPKEKRERERQELRDAKERKRDVTRQKEDIWEGRV